MPVPRMCGQYHGVTAFIDAPDEAIRDDWHD
jgi:hypothetical protein